MKNSVSKRFSLTCKFKLSAVELTILDRDTGAVQQEIIPVTLLEETVNTSSDSSQVNEKTKEAEDNGN